MTAAEFLSDDASNILKLIYTYAYGVMLSGFNLRLPLSPETHLSIPTSMPSIRIPVGMYQLYQMPHGNGSDIILRSLRLIHWRCNVSFYKININHNG